MPRCTVAAMLAGMVTAGAVVALTGCTGTVEPVAPTGGGPASAAKLAEAVAHHKRYLDTQGEALVARTREFADAVKAGNVEQAKALFPAARAPYERIEPAAESFRDLDLKLDGREDDGRDPDVAWTGYHRLEKDLWVDGLQPDSAQVADQLVADVTELRTRLGTLRPSPPELADGAKSLLDEITTRKLTGDEDRYSHTDLWDFAANLEGSRAAVDALRPVIDEKDQELGSVLDERFGVVEKLLDGHRVGDGFRSYNALTRNEIKRMTDAVDALSEAVSQVAGVVTS
jgi:iron uptake system component EfeO